MKTIATITASLLLSLGLLASPASAADKQPSPDNPASQFTECEQAARTASKATADLQRAETTIVELLAVNSGITETNTRLVLKVARKDARILLLKEKLAKARNN